MTAREQSRGRDRTHWLQDANPANSSADLRAAPDRLTAVLAGLHDLFWETRTAIGGIRLGVLIGRLNKPFSSWDEERTIRQAAWATVVARFKNPREWASQGATKPAGAFPPPLPELPPQERRFWVFDIQTCGGDRDAQRSLHRTFEEAAQSLIGLWFRKVPDDVLTPQARHFFERWSRTSYYMTGFPLRRTVYSSYGEREFHTPDPWGSFLGLFFTFAERMAGIPGVV